MNQQFKVLSDSLKLTGDNIRFVADSIGSDKGTLLVSCADSLQAAKTLIQYLSNSFETEKAIKNRLFDFLAQKGLLDEFYQK